MGGYFFYLSPSIFLLTMAINDYVRGCSIISVKAQVGVFLIKLFIVKREHSGCYVTDE